MKIRIFRRTAARSGAVLAAALAFATAGLAHAPAAQAMDLAKVRNRFELGPAESLQTFYLTLHGRARHRATRPNRP
ncbi:hypothetical protein RCO28_17165 [Streptomyces sp. LHD-70]|uniref:hypothetical protein n=1 Tax=Streptomyces sp. LHD-70 TaxID=3072140 RepID=UPI00280F26FF|nr:hypothetical protein [Streptomyces sp. LHD-70]MDQ8704204.1 hypothetical protein [Streptomyces sp. LHD-70]